MAKKIKKTVFLVPIVLILFFIYAFLEGLAVGGWLGIILSIVALVLIGVFGYVLVSMVVFYSTFEDSW